MMITEKKFSPEIVTLVFQVQNEIIHQYGIDVPGSVDVMGQKIYESPSLKGGIVQCGVWQGFSLFMAAKLCRYWDKKTQIYGFDTFDGFPEDIISDFDRPSYFEVLYQNGEISKTHLEKARERVQNFENESHLKDDHFKDINNLFSRVKNYPEIILVKGPFNQTLKSHQEPISILYLDCDLYQSYLDCLNTLYEHVLPGGTIIFDEYYSLKYPGARKAVNEFFKNKEGTFERYAPIFEGGRRLGFERWCFVKK